MAEAFWYAVSLIGSPELWLAAAVILAIVYHIHKGFWSKKTADRFRGFILIFIVSIVVALAVTQIIKVSTNIPRPCIPCPAEGCNPFCDSTPAFPSGHSSSIFAAFTSLYLVSGKKKFLPLLIIPILVAASRFFLGVHTIPDIVAGSIIGIAVTVAVYILEKWAGFLK